VQFGLSNANLEPDARAVVDALATWLVVHPDATAIVHGHADASGRDDVNLALIHERATNVAARLATFGIGRSRVTGRGFGAYQPVEGSPEESASNRRAVVYVKDAGSCPGERR